MTLVYVCYMDHVLFRNSDSSLYHPSIRECVGWVLKEDEEAIKIRDDVGFFQAVRAAIVKNTGAQIGQTENIDTAINQILSKAIISDRVIDVFEAAGLKKPDISILSDDFLASVKDMKQTNLPSKHSKNY